MKIAVYTKAIVFFFLCSSAVFAQDSTLHHPAFKNTVRINITPMLIGGNINNVTLGYERVLTKRISVSANVGNLQMPKIVKTSSDSPVQWRKTNGNRGFSSSLDVRFYFIDRNKFTIPDGLYWGPYATYYLFDNSSDIYLKDNEAVVGEATINTDLKILMTGVQIGYQFVLGKRWTIDLILFGPGVGFYSAQLGLETNVQLDQDSEYVQGIYDAITELYPGASTLLRDRELSKKGATRFTSAGFRYVFQVGFRF